MSEKNILLKPFDQKLLEPYFPNMQAFLQSFECADLFSDLEYPWSPLDKLASTLEDLVARFQSNVDCVDALAGLDILSLRDAKARGADPGFVVTDWIKLDRTICFPDLKIVLGKGTRLEPTAMVKGPCVVGENSDIRQGAYLRGNLLAGNKCTLGHNTEIKNSILMHHTEVGHFNYIGDSILGSYVNLGAGSKLANLEFRTPDEKENEEFPNIIFDIDGEETDIGRGKLGAVIGDYCEIGCNAVLSPATILGQDSRVYPNVTVPKNFYPPQSQITPRGRR